MTDHSKKSNKTPSMVPVGDSMEGIKNLRPDIIREKIQQANAQLKKSVVPTASSTTRGSAPTASNTKDTTPKGNHRP